MERSLDKFADKSFTAKFAIVEAGILPIITQILGADESKLIVPLTSLGLLVAGSTLAVEVIKENSNRTKLPG